MDIAGLVRGASRGEGLGNKFLSHIREVDAIVHVVRCFEDDNIIHVDGSVDPARDIETIETELILADLESVEKRRDKAASLVKKGEAKYRTEADAGAEAARPSQCGPFGAHLSAQRGRARGRAWLVFAHGQARALRRQHCRGRHRRGQPHGENRGRNRRAGKRARAW